MHRLARRNAAVEADAEQAGVPLDAGVQVRAGSEQRSAKRAARSREGKRRGEGEKADPKGFALVPEARRAHDRAIKQAQRDAVRQNSRVSRQHAGGSEPGDANAPVPRRDKPWTLA